MIGKKKVSHRARRSKNENDEQETRGYAFGTGLKFYCVTWFKKKSEQDRRYFRHCSLVKITNSSNFRPISRWTAGNQSSEHTGKTASPAAAAPDQETCCQTPNFDLGVDKRGCSI